MRSDHVVDWLRDGCSVMGTANLKPVFCSEQTDQLEELVVALYTGTFLTDKQFALCLALVKERHEPPSSRDRTQGALLDESLHSQVL